MLDTLIGKYKTDIMNVLNMFSEDFEARALKIKQSNDVISERHSRVESRYDMLEEAVRNTEVAIKQCQVDTK